ncbi:MAG: hypothetical protein Fur007_08640 [Rhodoferax sp.]
MLIPILVALVLALIAAVLWRLRAQGGVPVLAFAWLCHAVYELLIYRRILCTGDCSIRADLLLLYPALLGASLRQPFAARATRA